MDNVTKSPDLILRETMRIAGKAVVTDDVVEVFNPYNNQVVGTVPSARPEHVRDAFAKARAFKSKLTRYERQQILMRTAEILRDRREEFARLITAETGFAGRNRSMRRPRLRRLVVRGATHYPRRRRDILLRHQLRMASSARSSRSACRLMGVISAITPFNHPLNMVSHKLAPAIATNNRVVLKPTELTPLTALALADILYEAGLPPEMLSVVTGDPGHG